MIFLSDLQVSQTIDESFSIYQRHILQLGYDGVNYAFSPLLEQRNPIFNQPLFKLTDIFSADFMTHYQEGGLCQHDYTIRSALAGRRDVMNWQQDLRQSRLNAHEETVLHVAQDHGIHNGLTVPLMNNVQGLAGSSIVSHETGEAFTLLNAQQLPKAMHLTSLFHNHIWGEQSFELFQQYNQIALSHLSKTEKQLLRLLISGKPMKCICGELGITTRYGEKLSTNLRRKFGGISRNRLLYYAGRLNISETL